ncbi:MAG: response regulator, partial [Eubacterium sp.]|nr:response regulator [Eubacterium sp.]
RKTKNTPAIVLSAKNEVINRIELLRLGADDYISKPFDVDEVILRIEGLTDIIVRSKAKKLYTINNFILS